jgi:Holliday junction DNA helicase RuvA
MIDYIKGEVVEATPTYAVIDCSGIGYEINITVLDYTEISSLGVHKLYIHESIREDAHLLYGFLTKKERELFRLLIGVSGVGPNTARLILSSLSVDQLSAAIASGEVHALKAVKGVGVKTAQRILVDLKDKINTTELALNTSVPAGESFEDALAALVMLGFAQPQSRKVLSKIFADDPSVTTEKAIKQALTML